VDVGSAPVAFANYCSRVGEYCRRMLGGRMESKAESCAALNVRPVRLPTANLSAESVILAVRLRHGDFDRRSVAAQRD